MVEGSIGRRLTIPLAVALVATGGAVVARSVIAAPLDAAAVVAVMAERGEQMDIDGLATTAYRVPIADVARAGWGATHAAYPATDIFLGCGAELVSPVDGTVLEVRRIDAYDPAVDDPATRGGRSVSILGRDGVRYYLAHFDTIVAGLAPGDTVTAGQTIGTMGDTGRTSACHLHFAISPPCPEPEWRIRRGVVWPYPYLDAWRAGEQRSPVAEVDAWAAANPTACEDASANP